MSTRQYEQHLFDEYYDLEMLRNISQCIKIMSMQNKQQNTLGELYQAFNSICDEAHNTLRSIEEYTNELENVQLSNRKLDEEIAKNVYSARLDRDHR